MATTTLSLRTRIAWWVRPALFCVAVVARACSACAARCIDAIVDHGLVFEIE
ncbi:hypothetical protein [Massilia sp. DD77]|uniref:hypothetical protein n=1 Tax=Massilia sp. DD77 TaxID=3109349 RepID=UPI002FFFBBF9